uniref:Neurotransmitter-gated ion-channel ligand-binding domain-containing protein n=1 Tax=Timema shepardi TaxID=629360 RepID=A0A7R9AS51_TIMSH|nr:unnamed protein product [Timema shepardi]
MISVLIADVWSNGAVLERPPVFEQDTRPRTMSIIIGRDRGWVGWTRPKMESALLLALLLLAVIGGALSNPEAKRLYEDLLSNYNRLIRPVGNNSDRLTVKMGLRLAQLIDVGWGVESQSDILAASEAGNARLDAGNYSGYYSFIDPPPEVGVSRLLDVFFSAFYRCYTVKKTSVQPTEIRTLISPSSTVELNTTSALTNYATEAEPEESNNDNERLGGTTSAIYSSDLVGAEVYVLWSVVKPRHAPFLPTIRLKRPSAKEMLDMQAPNYINGDVEPVSS